jgi:Rrf2 family nitric oxide-sensitive transcriptional repressor
LRGYVVRALEAFYHELDGVTLQALVQGNCGLAELLALRPSFDGCGAGQPSTA